MSGANLLAKKDNLLQATNLGWVFAYNLYEAIHDFIDTPANVLAKVAASSLTPVEQEYLTEEVIPKYSEFDVHEGNHYVPTYYGNISVLLGEFGILAKLAEEGTPSPALKTLADQYSDETGKYLMSDEDEYKIAAEFMRLYLPAEADLAAAIDVLNAL